MTNLIKNLFAKPEYELLRSYKTKITLTERSVVETYEGWVELYHLHKGTSTKRVAHVYNVDVKGVYHPALAKAQLWEKTGYFDGELID